MANQYQVPGGPYLNESGSNEYQLPGGAFSNESQSTGVAIAGSIGTATASGFTASVSSARNIACAIGTAVASGFTATLSGTIVTDPLKNNTATVLANQTGIEVCVYSPTTGALVVKKTGQTTNASGIMTISDAQLVAGASYWIVIKMSGGALGFASETA